MFLVSQALARHAPAAEGQAPRDPSRRWASSEMAPAWACPLKACKRILQLS